MEVDDELLHRGYCFFDPEDGGVSYVVTGFYSRLTVDAQQPKGKWARTASTSTAYAAATKLGNKARSSNKLY